MKWSDLFKQKEESITASSGTTAPFPLTRVEWVMCHRIKIDHVHRPLYTFFMKLIFQCSPALFNKRCHIQWNLHCVFLLGRETNWTEVYLTNQDQEAAAAADASKVSYKENSPTLEISDKVACCERDGSNSFSCGMILMITFQLAFPSSWELFQAPSSRLSLGHEVGSPILLLLGIQASTHQESFIRLGLCVLDRGQVRTPKGFTKSRMCMLLATFVPYGLTPTHQ